MMFCDYCDNFTHLNGMGSEQPGRYLPIMTCDGWFYSHPKPFTTFYFYFLVFNGYSYSRKFMCHTCMRRRLGRCSGLIFFSF